MSYVPHTASERQKMLDIIGKKDISELFDSIPCAARFNGQLNLPDAKTEFEVIGELTAMASKNKRFDACFRGAGAYNHLIPSVVTHLASREEFVTAYTPYQAEMSQGVLQCIFEYQTTVCELTGMDVSNAGVYDGAHAAAEAAAMFRDRKRGKTVVFDNVKPQNLRVLQTYCHSAGAQLVVLPCKDGRLDFDALAGALDSETSSFYMEQPNFYGLLEDGEHAAQLVHDAGARLIMGCYPTSLALLKSPAQYGADAAVGEAQPLGMPLSFGGPYLGYMAVHSADMRRLPGRIVGQTEDKDGRTAYVLTLQAREQHIRREKASSSICSNESLCALTATIYCAAMGRQGLAEVARQCMAKAQYASKKLSAVDGFSLKFNGSFFNEFVTRCPVDPDALTDFLAERGILAGLPVTIDGESCMLWCVTEANTVDQIDALAELLKEAVK